MNTGEALCVAVAEPHHVRRGVARRELAGLVVSLCKRSAGRNRRGVFVRRRRSSGTAGS